MIEVYKELIGNQFEASLGTLRACLDRCPNAAWQEPVANLTFSQAIFHALFFADVYLGRDLASLRSQPFHADNAATFADYEELEDRPQRATYDKPFIGAYLEHVRGKATTVVANESADELSERPGFEWLPFSRAEVHVYNVRHLQHHAGQLGLRLRLEGGEGVPWFGSGWPAGFDNP